MRESNFAFPAQNRACVCITSQLYDRRALDTTSPLPLLNSLTHLTYLTSTSPRIREILTCDGGLERLVRLLRDFCFSPPPPENPSAIFGLSPPGLPRPPLVPTLNPKSFDRHAAYRFSLAFQSVVNIGVRGSEPIRSRVVQAGTLEVVGCILEAWLASKGFAVGPSASASGIPRESREQRQQRRQQQLEQRQREQAQELVRLLALERSLANAEDEQNVATSDAETTASTDTSANATPLGTGTPTGTVIVPGRDRSGTVVARRIWDAQPVEQITAIPAMSMSRSRTVRGRIANSATPSTSTSRPETETEDDGEADGDGDVEMETSMSQDHDDENMPLPPSLPHPRRTVGIVSDSPSPAAAGAVGVGVAGTSDALDVDLDAHIIINTNATDDGVSDGIVALDQNVNDDLAMGAPPGAPGAIDATPRTRTNTLTLNTRNMNITRDHHHHHHGHAHSREELTPRAVLATLPMHSHTHMPMPVAMPVAADAGAGPARSVSVRGAPTLDNPATRTAAMSAANVTAATATAPVAAAGSPASRTMHRHHHHHHHAEEPGPFREEDVLLSLQLLAYLSKYPHVRQAFYKPRLSFHPASAMVHGQGQGQQTAVSSAGVTPASSLNVPAGESSGWRAGVWTRTGTGSSTAGSGETKKDFGFFKTLTGRGKEKAPAVAVASGPGAGSSPAPPTPSGAASTPPRMTNVFSLVERFTFRPSPTESSLPTPPPFLPPEIQYWAGVIMRNACRKDESRGGVRQCANMLCGKWETFPREFAKCRRCRKAKYCGKECQSRAWSEGHRFWCSAREGDDVTEGASGSAQQTQNVEDGADGVDGAGSGGGRLAAVSTQERAERRQARDRERQRLAAAAAATVAAIQPSPLATTRQIQAMTDTEYQRAMAAVRHATAGTSNTAANSIAAFFGTGNIATPMRLPDATAAPMAIPISARRRPVAAAGPSNLPQAQASNQTPLPLASTTASDLPMPVNLSLSAYTAAEQATIRNFLQSVGMSEVDAFALQDDASGAGAGEGGVDIGIDVQSRGRGRGRERAREGERLLQDRIQALEVRDRHAHASSSRSARGGSGAGEDDMVLG